MTDTVIKAENIGKMYTIGHKAERGGYTSLRDVLTQNARIFWNKTKDLAMGKFIIQGDTLEEVWALQDVSFEIKRGETVGIIGRNGAGKSTLLKLLSRITEPSTGRVTIKGRVSSLLEVGTGFHPELTGRENIYLNGTIMGMTRVEIKQNFDKIVAFAEIEKYLDTPVKRYSSGMYVRLAFAVAAHLEPEILVVDEVLAVGDVQFQKKCLGKMGDVAKEGRTVLFVSHNMAAISSLCKKSIVLKSGKINFEGNVESGIDHYLNDADHVKGISDLQDKRSKWWKQPKTFSKLLGIETLDQNDKRQSSFKMGSLLKIKVRLEITNEREGIEAGVFFLDNLETIVGLLSSAAEGFKNIRVGINNLQIDIPEINLMPGQYTLGIWIVCQREVDDACENAISIDIVSNSFTGNYVDYDRFKGYGSIIRSNWRTVK